MPTQTGLPTWNYIIRWGEEAVWAAGVAAIIFAVHPVNTEAVAWVGCIPELFYTLLPLICTRKAARERSV
jgi:hypothetical protein